MTHPHPKSLMFIPLILTVFSGCEFKTTNSASASDNHNFYAHCTNTQSAVFDIVGSTGTPANGSQAESDGSVLLSENSDECQSAWAKFNVQPNLSGTTTEGLSIYTAGTSMVNFNLDFSPALNNPNAASVQTTGTIVSGTNYGATLTCTLYRAHEQNTPCAANVEILASCPNLNFEICAD